MTNYNFLVPWDIVVTKTGVSSLLDKKSSRKDDAQRSKESAQQLTPSVTMRVFIGMEYECPLGHRFICSGPDRIVRVSSNGTVKVLDIDLISLLDAAYGLKMCLIFVNN
jgi:protein SMG8